MNSIINILSKTHFYMRGGIYHYYITESFFFFLLNKKGGLQYHMYHSTPIKYHVKWSENSYHLTSYDENSYHLTSYDLLFRAFFIIINYLPLMVHTHHVNSSTANENLMLTFCNCDSWTFTSLLFLDMLYIFLLSALAAKH